MPTRFRTRPAQNAARIEQRQECSQKADLPRPMLGGMGRCGARKAGFTIAELLIVVAIVGVLVAIAIPVFTSQLEKAQEATCLANRRSVKGLVVADYLDSHTELTSERFAELVAEVGPNLCPNGGEYGYEGTVEGGGGIVITCSVHGGGEGGESTNEEKTLTFMETWLAFVDNSGLSGWEAKNNDKLRDAFFKKYGDSLPTLSVENESLIVQPYYASDSSESWLFAGKTTGNNWSTGYVNDPATGKWYQCVKANGSPTTTSIKFSSLEDLHNALSTTAANGNHWIELTDYTITTT